MKLFLSISAIVVIFWGQGYAQAFLPEKANQAWLDSLTSTRDLDDKLKIVAYRIAADTNVLAIQFTDKNNPESDVNTAHKSELCKPLVLIGDELVYFKPGTSPEEIIKWTKLLTPDNIKSVKVEEPSIRPDKKTRRCGMVLIAPRNRKIKKELLRLNGY